MSHETYSFGQYTGIVEDDYNQQLSFDFKEKRKIKETVISYYEETDTDGKVTKAAFWTHSDTDISKESTEVQGIANAVWTDAIKKAYKAHMESTIGK